MATEEDADDRQLQGARPEDGLAGQAWLTTLGMAASMPPAGQTRQMNSGCSSPKKYGIARTVTPRTTKRKCPVQRGSSNLGVGILAARSWSQAEGAGPAAEQAAHQGPEHDQQADGHEGNQVQR